MLNIDLTVQYVTFLLCDKIRDEIHFFYFKFLHLVHQTFFCVLIR